jgi:glyceraldehyde-3-phosphate dehydrogenase/erythrose-4-phosphate dehydrogenase
MTRVVDGSLVKIMSWYDNEWGFTHQMGPRVTRHAWRRRRDLKGQMARL